jgi:hypothetical protein
MRGEKHVTFDVMVSSKRGTGCLEQNREQVDLARLLHGFLLLPTHTVYSKITFFSKIPLLHGTFTFFPIGMTECDGIEHEHKLSQSQFFTLRLMYFPCMFVYITLIAFFFW